MDITKGVKSTFLVCCVLTALFGLSDTDISVADTGVPNDEVASSVSKANNSSASATITITMTGVINE